MMTGDFKYREPNRDDTVAAFCTAVCVIGITGLLIAWAFAPKEELKCLRQANAVTVTPVGHKYITSYYITLEDGTAIDRTEQELKATPAVGRPVCLQWNRE